MPESFSRSLYRKLLGLYPSSFRERFGDEMLWIFDEFAPREGVLRVYGDVLLSLCRQWTQRYALAGDTPLATSPHALFAWSRIAYPAPPLPIARIVQGGFVSVALVALVSLSPVTATHVRSIPTDACGTRKWAPEPSDVSETFSLREAKPTFESYVQVRAKLPDSAQTSPPPKSDVWVPYPVFSNQPVAVSTEDFVAANPGVGTPVAIPGATFVATFAETSAATPVTTPRGDPPALPFEVTPPSPAPAAATAQVITAQYNNARTGANPMESTLTPANVNVSQFGKLFTLKVDGDVYAQPLYLPDVEIPGKGTHNVLFVATENDSVYAFDADDGSAPPLWQAKLANSAIRSAPLSDRDTQCFFIVPQIGITSTPVIDPKTGTIYVLARTKESKGMLHADEFKQRLHALAITTGAEKFGGPVEVKATVQAGAVNFDPLRENQRAALLLANNSVYVAWGSSCDVTPYYGWVISYDAHTLTQKSVFNTAPDKSLSSVWQGDAGPAADKDGNVFVVTGNGEFDAANNGRDYGDSVLKLNTAGGRLTLADYFTPSNQAQLNARDNDLGSSGPVLLPDQPGPHPHLLITAGKEGKLYLIDRDTMGKFQPGDDPHAVQTLSASNGAFGAVAYWNGHVYFIGSERALQDFSVTRGQLVWKANGPTRFLDSGATPVVSSNGQQNGIVWAASSKNWDEPTGRAAVLYAFDAMDVKKQLYTSERKGARDRAGVALRFAMPTVVNGKVYLGARREVDVYGLLPAHLR